MAVAEMIDERLRHRAFVGNGEVDARLVSGGGNGVQPPFGAAGQFQGRPAPGRFTTPISRHHTPARSPVPSALAQASLAAKRLA